MERATVDHTLLIRMCLSAGDVQGAVPSLLDLRSTALLAYNAPAASRAMHALVRLRTAAQSSDEGSAWALLLQALTLLPSAQAVGDGEVLVVQSVPEVDLVDEPSGPSLAAVHFALAAATQTRNGQSAVERARTALKAADALRVASADIAGVASYGPAGKAAAAELALHSASALRQVLPLLCTADSTELASVTRAVAGALGAESDASTASAFSCAQALSLRAAAAAEGACELAEAALRCSGHGELGRWHLPHLLLHSGCCSMLLLEQLGLGALFDRATRRSRRSRHSHFCAMSYDTVVCRDVLFECLYATRPSLPRKWCTCTDDIVRALQWRRRSGGLRRCAHSVHASASRSRLC